MKFICFQRYLIDMRKVFSLKQKGKYPKDNVCFDEVVTIKPNDAGVFYQKELFP